jgi:hypothetical protein
MDVFDPTTKHVLNGESDHAPSREITKESLTALSEGSQISYRFSKKSLGFLVTPASFQNGYELIYLAQILQPED